MGFGAQMEAGLRERMCCRNELPWRCGTRGMRAHRAMPAMRAPAGLLHDGSEERPRGSNCRLRPLQRISACALHIDILLEVVEGCWGLPDQSCRPPP